MSHEFRIALVISLSLYGSISPASAGTIDHAFVSDLEGGQKLEGYVPNPTTSNSGVTIATGVDLGARTEAELTALGLAATLIAKLKPYLGLKKEAALQYENQHPLVVTQPEADAIDKAVQSSIETALAAKYDAAIAPGLKKFADLPSEAMTVIFSVRYQYGDLATKAPKFWGWVVKQDWKSAVRELWNFGDAYETRRFKEGDLLAKIVTDLPTIGKAVGMAAANEAADVKVIQTLLKEKAVYTGAISGVCDAPVIAAIKAYQQMIGLSPIDGVISPGKKTYRRLVAF